FPRGALPRRTRGPAGCQPRGCQGGDPRHRRPEWRRQDLPPAPDPRARPTVLRGDRAVRRTRVAVPRVASGGLHSPTCRRLRPELPGDRPRDGAPRPRRPARRVPLVPTGRFRGRAFHDEALLRTLYGGGTVTIAHSEEEPHTHGH